MNNKQKQKYRQKSENPPTVSHRSTSTDASNTNLRAGTRGDYRSRDQELRIKNDVFSLLDSHTDYEIMDILKIPNSTYYRYKKMLNDEAAEIWAQQFKEGIELRILHTINSINLALRINKEIALDTNQSAKDRIESAHDMVETEINFIKMLRDVRDKQESQTAQLPEEEKPDYPYIVKDGKYFADPKWIKENEKKVMKGYKRATSTQQHMVEVSK